MCNNQWKYLFKEWAQKGYILSDFFKNKETLYEKNALVLYLKSKQTSKETNKHDINSMIFLSIQEAEEGRVISVYLRTKVLPKTGKHTFMKKGLVTTKNRQNKTKIVSKTRSCDVTRKKCNCWALKMCKFCLLDTEHNIYQQWMRTKKHNLFTKERLYQTNACLNGPGRECFSSLKR